MNPIANISHAEETSKSHRKAKNSNSLIRKDGVVIVERNASNGIVDSPSDTSTNSSSGTMSSQSFQKNRCSDFPSRVSRIESHTFPYLRVKMEAEARRRLTRLTNIYQPNEHDVLSGRGNFVNYHRGNQFYRSLVKKHFLQYVASPKSDKPKYALLIYHEICMQNPPGRFLRQDAHSKIWHDVGERKALDKTRQALREGAPDFKSNENGELLEHRVTPKTENKSLEGKVDMPGVEDPLSSTNNTRCEGNNSSDHVDSTDIITQQEFCAESLQRKRSLLESHRRQSKRSSVVPPCVHQLQQSQHEHNFSYGSVRLHQCRHQINQASTESQQKQDDRSLHQQPPHAYQYDQQSNRSLFEPHHTQQQRYQSNISPSKPHNVP